MRASSTILCAALLLTSSAGCAAHAPNIPGPTRTLAWARPAPRPAGRSGEAAPTTGPATSALGPSARGSAATLGGPRGTSPYGAQIASAARYYLDHPTSGFRSDCSGFVEASTARAGAPHRGSTRDLWAQLEARGDVYKRTRPEAGDLAFFDNTYDRDGDGRRDDPLTHIAVVLSVDADGTILLAHDGTSKGRATLHMNLLHPHDASGPNGQRFNDALRARRANDPEGAATLASELWRGFGVVRPR